MLITFVLLARIVNTPKNVPFKAYYRMTILFRNVKPLIACNKDIEISVVTNIRMDNFIFSTRMVYSILRD